MSTSRLFSLISAGLLIFTIIGVVGFWWPRYQSFGLEVKSLSAKNQEIQQKEDYFSTMRSIDDKVGNYTEQLAKIDMAFPSNIEDGLGSFISFLYGTASQSGVLINKIDWNAEADKKANLVKVSFDNSGLAPYEKVKGFIDQLYKNSRLITLELFQISRGKGETGLNKDAPREINFSIFINFNKNSQSGSGGAFQK